MMTGRATAEVVNVLPGADTLQAAFDAAAEGDELVLADGTCTCRAQLLSAPFSLKPSARPLRASLSLSALA